VLRSLLAGHTVRGTVRDPDSAGAKELMAFEGAAERLTLWKAELLTPDAFDEVVVGCDVVMHTASPFILECSEEEAEEKLFRPAKEGCANVLGSCKKAASVKRVVLTSSTAAMYDHPGESPMIDESSWNELSHAGLNAYSCSKVKSERHAWELAKEAGFELVVVNPGLFIGPPATSRAAGESLDLMKKIFEGSFTWVPKLAMTFVDIRDVAKAHLSAGLDAKWHGRNLICSCSDTFMGLGQMVRTECQFENVATDYCPYCPLILFAPYLGMNRQFFYDSWDQPLIIDNGKSVREYGFEYIPLNVSVRHMVEEMKKLKLITAP